MTIAKIVTDVSYTGNASGFAIGAYLTNDAMMLISILFGTCTVVVSWYYKRREDKRQIEKHALDMGTYKSVTAKSDNNEA